MKKLKIILKLLVVLSVVIYSAVHLSFATVEQIPIEDAPFPESTQSSPPTKTPSPSKKHRNDNKPKQKSDFNSSGNNGTTSSNEQAKPYPYSKKAPIGSSQQQDFNSDKHYPSNFKNPSMPSSDGIDSDNRQRYYNQKSTPDPHNYANQRNSMERNAVRYDGNESQNPINPNENKDSLLEPAPPKQSASEELNSSDASNLQNSQAKPKVKKKITEGASEPKPFNFEFTTSTSDIEDDADNKLLSAQLQDNPENSNDESSKTAPQDLPTIDPSEIILPQVPATNVKNSGSLFQGIIAWSLIALGVIIIVVIIVKGARHSKDFSLNNNISKKKKKKNSKLLSDKYYENR